MRADFQGWVATHQSRFEKVLHELLPRAEAAPQRLHEAMRYAVLDGGKRVRPLLVFAAGELVGADLARLNIAAAAVELIHAYSLVHDDMPCMDDDVLRRGKPTCHVQYDEATALLAGDSLQSLAFQLLAEHRLNGQARFPHPNPLPQAGEGANESLREFRANDDAQRQLEMIKLLAVASGSRGMAGGQAIDLASVGKSLTLPELEFMHIHKTGALIRAAILLGAHCGATDEHRAASCTPATLAKLDRFGKQIGLAFQVVDDLLDCEADTATLGKTAGKDAGNDKPTYVTLLGIQAARDMAQQLHRGALDSLAEFGDAAQRLRELADFIVFRKF
ncbi:MAG: polyprenyl synthetase family protein [Gallionella sp.]|nr:polyprenyl synthetase family protein [Gallionella sp.]